MSTLTVNYKGVTITTEESGYSQRVMDHRIKEIVRAIDEEVKAAPVSEDLSLPKRWANREKRDKEPGLEPVLVGSYDNGFLKFSLHEYFNKPEPKVSPDFKVGDYVCLKNPDRNDHGKTFKVEGTYKENGKLIKLTLHDGHEMRTVSPDAVLLVPERNQPLKPHLLKPGNLIKLQSGDKVELYKVLSMRYDVVELAEPNGKVGMKCVRLSDLFPAEPPKPKKEPKPVTDLTRFVAAYKQAGLSVEVKHGPGYSAIMDGLEILNLFNSDGSLRLPWTKADGRN